MAKGGKALKELGNIFSSTAKGMLVDRNFQQTVRTGMTVIGGLAAAGTVEQMANFRDPTLAVGSVIAFTVADGIRRNLKKI